jgi:hypothetical protein
VRLEAGEHFREAFFLALLRSTMVIVVLSYDALEKMFRHDRTAIDNVLLEWISALACKDMGIVDKIYPVVIGQWDCSSNRCGNLYRDGAIDRLPDVVPSATIAEAQALFAKNGLSLPVPMERMTVRALVGRVNSYLGFLAWAEDDSGSDLLTKRCCERVVAELNNCSPDRLNMVSNEADPSVVVPVALAHSSSSPARIGVVDSGHSEASAPAAAAVVGVRDVGAAWALLADPKCVKASDKEALSTLLDDLGVETATDLEKLLKADGWEHHLEPVIGCLKIAKQVTFREHLGMS